MPKKKSPLLIFSDAKKFTCLHLNAKKLESPLLMCSHSFQIPKSFQSVHVEFIEKNGR